MATLVTQPRSQERRSRVKWPSSLSFPLILFLIVTCFYWRLVFTYQFDWMWSPDLADQILPWWQEEARQLQHGQFPLWDTHSWMGQPFLGQAQPGAAYPLNWMLWLVPRAHGFIQMWAVQWYYVIVHYMAALFAYLLCRDLGRSRPASLIAGLAFGLAGYVGGTDWPQMVNGAVWTPLVFLFLLRAVRGFHPASSAALSGACIGMAWLSGHHQIPIFLTLASAGVWLFYVLRDGHLNWRLTRLAALALAIAPIVGALQIFPAQEYGRLAWRWADAADHVGWNDVIPYYVHARHAMHPIHLFGILIPGLSDNSDPFFGVIAISLAILAIAIWWREPAVKLFSAIALAGLVYSLGAHSVFQGFIYAVVPFVEKARVPAAAIFLFHAGCATLAAFGVDALIARKEPDESHLLWIRRVGIGAAAVGLVIATVALVILLHKKLIWDFDDRVVMTMLAALALAAILYACRTHNLTRRQAATLLTLLLLFEVGANANLLLADRNDPDGRKALDKAWGNRDIAAFFERQPRPFRVDNQTDDIVDNWGDYYNVDFVRAQAGVTVNSFRLETNTASTQKLLGAKFTVSRGAAGGGQTEVFQGASGIKVYQNSGIFPHAWAVHQTLGIRSVDAGRAFVQNRVEELRSKALVMGSDAPSLTPCASAADTVQVVKYAPSKVTLAADMTCEGMLVLSDTYYPGWSATVDGESAKIYEVDMAFRGVLVPQGAHTIAFQYRPASVFWGAGLTFAGLTGVALLTLSSRKKRPLGHPHHH
jgi:hypothetical protein